MQAHHGQKILARPTGKDADQGLPTQAQCAGKIAAPHWQRHTQSPALLDTEPAANVPEEQGDGRSSLPLTPWVASSPRPDAQQCPLGLIAGSNCLVFQQVAVFTQIPEALDIVNPSIQVVRLT